ncbi:MAG: hypothetical protein KC457_35530, partial [Myxococcales bacterium]|nr:hypothetical protein [Myxococcales bacterium]
DGSLFRIYVDGALVHTQPTYAPPAPTPVRWIGRVDNLFVGSIADVRLWTRVRSQEEIQADMNRRLHGNEAGLAGYWPLDGGTEDRSRHGNHGTLLANASLRLVQHPLPAAPPWSPALWVNGSWAQLPDHPSLILGSHYTQEAWIRPEINDDAFHGFLGNQPDAGPRSPSLWVYQRRSIHFVYGDGPWSQQGGITGPVLSGEPGRWHHVAASFDGSLFRIYVDGALVHTQPTYAPPAPT